VALVRVFALIVVLGVLCVLGLIAGVAHADPPARDPERTVAVVGIEITGDAAPLRSQMQQSLRRGLESRGYQGLDFEQVMHAIEDTPELIGCVSTKCLERIGKVVAARKFLRMHVDGSGAAYTVVLELLSAGVEGGVERRLERACTVCTISELSDVVTEAAAELVSPTRVESVPVTIATRPEGATLRIDDGDPVTGPLSIELPPGVHTVRATLDRHAPTEQTIKVGGGSEEAQRFEIVLTPLAPPDDRRARPYKRLKWVTAGGAAAALITGLVLVSLDGDGTCSLQDPQTECPEEYDTMTGGVLTLIAGVGLGGASGYMFWHDGKAAERSGAALTPTRDGATVTYTLRW
jgi:hypothetical protein